MQDIVFYAAAHETLGIVRDSANANKKPAPILALGVSVCLRMRLFAGLKVASPYPLAAFNDIVDWQWSMDADFNRNTACKLVADSGGISVHTVSDTVDNQTMDFTEFVIPISNMNTQELTAWLGNEKRRSGLTGDLVGYDSAGNAVFTIQIENFTVRNRTSGLCDPTVLDQEVVTRTQAESLINTAVSASAATKQDKLNSSNAGTGISVTSNGVISTANVPQSAVTGLSASLAAKQDNITAGDLIEVVGGSTVNRKRYMNIIEDAGILTRTITVPNGTATVSAYVLEPGNAYKIHVASTTKWLATTAAFKASTGTWGIEGHVELFVTGTGYVRTDSNVVLANALEPDAVNNCTLRFHDGKCIISVEDHVYGYIVVSASGTSSGSLYYGLATASNEYIAIDASLNGQTLDLGGATTYAGEKHVVGNGYTETILSGGIVCTSKTTFSNLSMNGVSVSGGTMILGDVNIPSGATVSVSGGGLAVEKVTGNGGTIDLGGTHILVVGKSIVSGATVKNGISPNPNGGAFQIYQNKSLLSLNSVTVSDCRAGNGGGVYVGENTLLSATSCTLVNNSSYDIFANLASECQIAGCTFGSAYVKAGGIQLSGVNTFSKISGHGSVTISSGAILDLTENTNTTPINPGGGVTFAEGGATVYPSAGSASAVTIGGGTFAAITNGGVLKGPVSFTNNETISGNATIDLNQTHVSVGYGAHATVNGCTFINGVAPSGNDGGCMYVSSGTLSATRVVFSGGMGRDYGGGAVVVHGSAAFESCSFLGNSAYLGGGICVRGTAQVHVESCAFSGNMAGIGGKAIRDEHVAGGACVIKDCTFSSGQTIEVVLSSGIITLAGSNVLDSVVGSGAVTISSGAIVDLTGNTNATPIAPGAGITFDPGDDDLPTGIIVDSAGSSHTFADAGISGTSITNLGLVYGATVSFPSADKDYVVYYTTDGGETSSYVNVFGSTVSYVVSGGLIAIGKLDD